MWLAAGRSDLHPRGHAETARPPGRVGSMTSRRPGGPPTMDTHIRLRANGIRGIGDHQADRAGPSAIDDPDRAVRAERLSRKEE